MDSAKKLSMVAFGDEWQDLTTKEKRVASRSVRWCIEHQAQLPSRAEAPLTKTIVLLAIDESLKEIYGRGIEFYQRRDRRRATVDVRNMAMLLYYNRTRSTLTEIGTIFGLTHATVIHGIANVRDLCDTSREYRGAFQRLKIKVQEKCETLVTSSGGPGSSPELF